MQTTKVTDKVTEWLSIAGGDIFASGAEVLVNPVNCVGVMGAGLAKVFKRRFPDAFEQYKRACRDGTLEPGRVYPTFVDDQCILHFPTKRHWKDSSLLEWIEQGLESLNRHMRELGRSSVAMPALGCGLGGLDFADVSKLIRAVLAPGGQSPPYRVMLYRPR